MSTLSTTNPSCNQENRPANLVHTERCTSHPKMLICPCTIIQIPAKQPSLNPPIPSTQTTPSISPAPQRHVPCPHPTPTPLINHRNPQRKTHKPPHQKASVKNSVRTTSANPFAATDLIPLYIILITVLSAASLILFYRRGEKRQKLHATGSEGQWIKVDIFSDEGIQTTTFMYGSVDVADGGDVGSDAVWCI